MTRLLQRNCGAAMAAVALSVEVRKLQRDSSSFACWPVDAGRLEVYASSIPDDISECAPVSQFVGAVRAPEGVAQRSLEYFAGGTGGQLVRLRDDGRA